VKISKLFFFLKDVQIKIPISGRYIPVLPHSREGCGSEITGMVIKGFNSYFSFQLSGAEYIRPLRRKMNQKDVLRMSFCDLKLANRRTISFIFIVRACIIKKKKERKKERKKKRKKKKRHKERQNEISK
jgi:hypothetical protein